MWWSFILFAKEYSYWRHLMGKCVRVIYVNEAFTERFYDIYISY